MSCTDCGGGVPESKWKRCEACAMSRLRTMIGGAPRPSIIERRFHIGERVIVTHKGAREAGKVARRPHGRAYVIDLDNGERCYMSVSALSPEPSTSSAPV